MTEPNKYTHDLRITRSLLIVTSLQKKADIKAQNLIKKFKRELNWSPSSDLLIEKGVWNYIVEKMQYDPKQIFCHPDTIIHNPKTIIYYRGLCGLSLKASRDYFGRIDSLEAGMGKLNKEKALKISRTFNAFICSIIKNSTKWTLRNGYRTIVATLGITIDGIMRNNIGDIAEERIRSMILEWLATSNLVLSPNLPKHEPLAELPKNTELRNDITMIFSSEPDISFIDKDGLLISVVEIKGGTDPAGALERYGAAKKSFENSIHKNPHCQNYYLAASYTNELKSRIGSDRLVHKIFDIIELLDKPEVRSEFFKELFHHTLRVS